MTWNIEGIKAHQYFLSEALLSQLPDLVFLSEPQAFQCDMGYAMKTVSHEYCHWLNSEDLYDQELSLVKSKAKGGTLVMWRKWLDPHISVHPVQSPAFLPLILQLPGAQTSAHIAVYLPTSGKDYEFISASLTIQKLPLTMMSFSPSSPYLDKISLKYLMTLLLHPGQ
jgi:hypothetical protein